MPTPPANEKKGAPTSSRDRHSTHHWWGWLLLPVVALCILGAYLLGQQSGRPEQAATPPPAPVAAPPAAPPRGRVTVTELPQPAIVKPPPATPPAPTTAPKPQPMPQIRPPVRMEAPVVLPKEVGDEPAPADGSGEELGGTADSADGAEVVTQEPALLNNPALEYPSSAYEAGVEGTVRISYIINETGEVEAPRVAKSSGDDRLDRAAVEYVTRLKFQPATRDGQPVTATQERNVQFSLR